jgi:hypothetical protein
VAKGDCAGSSNFENAAEVHPNVVPKATELKLAEIYQFCNVNFMTFEQILCFEKRRILIDTQNSPFTFFKFFIN